MIEIKTYRNNRTNFNSISIIRYNKSSAYLLSMQSSFVLLSAAFKEGEAIPKMYGYHEKNISPPLEWKGAPTGTKSFALISDDPDCPSGTWTHWVMWNIPADCTSLKEGIGI